MSSSVAYNTLLIKKNEPLEEQHQKITFFNFNFNLIQRALVLEDYAPALGVAGFVSRKKGARSKGKEEKEGKKKNNNNSR